MNQKLFFLGLLLAGLVVGIDAVPANAQSAQAAEVVRLVNELRASKGLPAYRVDGTLTSIAQAQADWSAANNHIGHDGPGGNRPRDRALAGGYGGGKTISAQENIASGTLPYITPDWVVLMWQGDDIHLGALLSTNHDDIGVGYAEANGSAWYVMMIGRVGTGTIAPTRQPQVKPETPVSSVATEVPVATIVSVQLNTPGPDGSIQHVVQDGQTAWTVAAYYGIELQELLALNNLTEDAVLCPGDVLLIHPPEILNTPMPFTSTPTSAQIAAIPTATQAPTEVIEIEDKPASLRSSSKYIPDEQTILIWFLLVVAVIVFIGSMGRAVYILRRRRAEQESLDE
ncbi:MAG: LysM peptidoglycan-binding domain-containing protein [Anaerolineae bacterium]|nr:LysM peptidoglycan-binding domain-containing protein [Anaerolineae bacterium]